MKIEPKHATFAQSKWLKEKGFDEETNCYYFEDGEFRRYRIQDTYGYYGEEYVVELEELYKNWNDNFVQKKNGDRCFGCDKQKEYFETFSAPEQWQLTEWLLVNHGIYVFPEPYCNENNELKFSSNWCNTKFFNQTYKSFLPKTIGIYDSPQEAYSAAFDYIKNNNLI
jgi:hypothetical protein